MVGTAFKELYHNAATNAEILASASEIFCSLAADKEARTKHGRTFNKLLIISAHPNAFTIKLDDGGSGQTYPFPGLGSFSIKPEEGRFFSTVKITAGSAATITAAQISIDYAICIEA